MRGSINAVFQLAFLVAASLLLAPEIAVAQTGPGGVGNSDGSTASGVNQPQNALWLRADEGVTTNGDGNVTTWADQSGNGNDGSPELDGVNPPLETSFGGFGGAPAVKFRQNKRDVIKVTENSDLDNTPGITIFSVFHLDTVDGNARGIFAKRKGPGNDQSYNIFTWNSDELNFDVDGTGNRIVGDGLVAANNQYLAGGRYSNAEGEGQLYLDGNEELTNSYTTSVPDENTSPLRLGVLTTGGNAVDDTDTGRFFEGRIGEVVIYRTALNEAQRTIVNTYLANKYSLSTGGTEVFSYAHGSFSDDIAGIGRASNGDEHQFAQSSLLGFGAAGGGGAGAFEASGFGSNDQYIFLGHNGLGTTAFVEPINGLTADAKRLGRTWKADFKGSIGTKSVTIEVDATLLPSQPDPQDDSYFVVVDGSSANFNGAPEAYELTGSDTLSTTVELEDGDHVTIGAGQRTVNFTSTTGSGFENTATPTVTAKLNLPYTSSTKSEVDGTGTSVDVTIGEEGDLDGSGLIEDGGVTNEPGSNSNGDFEADDNDAGTSDTDGAFDGDYRLDTGFSNPLTIGPGSDEATVNVEIDDDGLQEQTEKFEVTIDGVTNGQEGSDGRLVYTINDDDEVRDLTLLNGDDGNSKDEDNTNAPETFTVTLDQDGTGTSPATSAPWTTVEFVVDEEQTDATAGTNLSDPTVDFKIVDESGSGGTEFQERLSPTRGRLNFEDGSNSGSETAELKLEINQDNVDDLESEDIVLTLEDPQSAKLSQDTDIQPSPNLDLKFTINDDDSAPNVQFTQSSSGGDESTDSSIDLELSSTSGGPDVSGDTVTVDFSIDAANSSATEGASDDFTTSPAGDTLTFAPGRTTRSLTVNVQDDNLDEIDETVKIDLDGSGDETTEPTTGATVGSPASHTYTIRDDDSPAIGSTGPGGVGDAETSGRLKLWLRADAIADSIATDGDPLSTWPDTSGNDNDASASGSNTPTYRASVTDNNGRGNNRPAVEFDGVDDIMEGTLTIAGNATYFAVVNGNKSGNNKGRGAVAEFASDSNPGVDDTRNGLWLPGNEIQYLYEDGSVLSGASTDGDDTNESGFVIFEAEDAGDTASIQLNGGSSSSTTVPVNGTLNNYAIGDLLAGGDEISGDIGEVIAFSGTLTEVQRILVQNYLSAKYDIALSSGDKYAGDDGVNGDYDRGVFGVGQASGGSLHSAAETDGLRFNLAGGLESGDFLLAGHRTAANSATTSDIGGVGGNLEARSDRAWYIDRSNDANAAITVDVTVDLSEAGLVGPAGAAGSYVLMDRTADTNNNWSAIQNGADAVSGDEITFNGVTLTDGNELTLGTTDAANSPLVTNELIITGNSGGADGKDQGWRYLGLPATGATAGDLLRGNGATFIDFSVDMAYTNPGGDVQGSGTGWTLVSDPSDALTNGRGFILWLYDDQVYPLDPSITLKTAAGVTPPGEADVTVGDGIPAGDDPSLAQSNKQFLLANPYAVPFGLRSLFNTGAGGVSSDGFDSVVQIWEADATDGGNDISGQNDENIGSFVTRSRSSNDRISPWQGFLLTRTSTGSGEEQVTFGSNGRAPGVSVGLVGSKVQTEGPVQHRVPLLLVGRDADGAVVALDRAVSVLFHEEASEGRDYLDSPKFEPMAESYATLAPLAANGETTLRAQESRPVPQTTERVPLSFQTEGVSGTFEIAIPEDGSASTETPSIPEDWEIQLIDTKGTADPSDDAVQSLTPGGEAYTFDVSADKAAASGETSATNTDEGPPRPTLRRLEPSSSADAKSGAKATNSPPRFALKVQPADALPVELAGIEARRTEGRAVLTWQTASETNNAGFKVQHQRLPTSDTTATPSASDWKNLGFVEGAGTTTSAKRYRFETDALDYGRHVFRLKQVDTDGSSTPTDPVEMQMRLEASHAVEAPYPNPVRRQATLPVTVREAQQVTVTVYDLLGRKVHVVHKGELQEQNTKRISLSVQDLASGAYFVRVRGEDFSTTRRFTVVR